MFYALPEEKLSQLEMAFHVELVRWVKKLDRYFAISVNILRLRVLPTGIFQTNFRLPGEEKPEGFTHTQIL